MALPEIQTERLTLRPLAQTDAPVLAEAVNDPDISRWTPLIPYPYALRDAQDFIAKGDAGEMKPALGVWEAGGFVGVVGINKELGYWFAKPAWGKGYATEASRAVMAHHFATPLAPPLRSSYLAGNQASARVLQKLGFAPTGEVGRATPLATGVEVATHKLLLTPEQYHALNPWVIATERLRIRPLDQGDVADLARIGGHKDVAPMIFAATVPWPEDKVSRFIEVFRWRGRMGFRMGIERDGALIGQIAFGAPPKAKLPQMAYFLDPAQWGQGLMTEALRAFLPAAMDRFGVTELGADAFDDNPGSQHLLQKLGFVKTGEEMGTSAARLEPAPVSVYRLTREALG